jgi:hypothetical protein
VTCRTAINRKGLDTTPVGGNPKVPIVIRAHEPGREQAEDEAAVAAIRARADRSMAILEATIARRTGTGRYLVLHPGDMY